MCGIFGAISLGGEINKAAIKGLAWANRQRGTDSIGFFDSEGRTIRVASDPANALADKGMQEWLNNFNGFAIGGHTRYATQGSVCKRNAHPFRYGDITGSHNGIVDAPYRYVVDSEFLIDTISQGGYKALENVDGYWGLSWYDASDDSFWLTMHDGQLAFSIVDDVVYYSSDKRHLASIVGGDVFSFSEGQVVKFVRGDMPLDSEQGHIDGLDVKYSFRGNIGFHTCGVPASKVVTTDATQKTLENAGFTGKDDYEAWVERREAGGIMDDTHEDFRDAWKDYSDDEEDTKVEEHSGGLHSMTDEQFAEFCTGDGEIGGEG